MTVLGIYPEKSSLLFVARVSESTDQSWPLVKNIILWEFPGGPVVRTPQFHCRGHGLDPWSGNSDPACRTGMPKNKKKGTSSSG